MLTANRIQGTNIVEAKLDGEVQSKELETLRSEMDSALADHEKMKLLVVYEGLGRMDPQAIWKDLKIETRMLREIEKLAVVSEKGWFEKLAGVLDSIMGMEIKTFEPGRRDEALRWLEA